MQAEISATTSFRCGFFEGLRITVAYLVPRVSLYCEGRQTTDSPHNEMPYIKFHGGIWENNSHCIANMAAVVSNEYFWQRDIECLAAHLEAFKEFAYLSVRLSMAETLAQVCFQLDTLIYLAVRDDVPS
jgi:hypothetical protein